MHVGRKGDHRIDAQLRNKFRFAIRPRQRRRRGCRPQQLQRVRIKSKYDGRPVNLAAHGDQLGNNLSVAEMDAIKVSNRNGASPQRFVKGFKFAKPLHSAVSICEN